jgi:hypothetical protein
MQRLDRLLLSKQHFSEVGIAILYFTLPQSTDRVRCHLHAMSLFTPGSSVGALSSLVASFCPAGLVHYLLDSHP